jgi:hypothetical protein
MHSTRHRTRRQFTRVGDYLVWRQRHGDGTPWVQRCSQAAFTRAVRALEERAATGCTLDELSALTGLSIEEVAVAVNFLLDYGCLKTRWTRFVPVRDGLAADARLAWQELRDLREPPLPLFGAPGC